MKSKSFWRLMSVLAVTGASSMLGCGEDTGAAGDADSVKLTADNGIFVDYDADGNFDLPDSRGRGGDLRLYRTIMAPFDGTKDSGVGVFYFNLKKGEYTPPTDGRKVNITIPAGPNGAPATFKAGNKDMFIVTNGDVMINSHITSSGGINIGTAGAIEVAENVKIKGSSEFQSIALQAGKGVVLHSGAQLLGSAGDTYVDGAPAGVQLEDNVVISAKENLELNGSTVEIGAGSKLSIKGASCRDCWIKGTVDIFGHNGVSVDGASITANTMGPAWEADRPEATVQVSSQGAIQFTNSQVKGFARFDSLTHNVNVTGSTFNPGYDAD